KEPHHFTVAASLFLLYLSLGSLYFTLTDESLSFLDSLYFLIVSFTTTGYGDIVASQGGSRAMISLLILLGMITMGYVAAVFSDLFANKLHKQILKRNKREMSVQSFDYELKKANSKALYSVICILTIVLLGSAVISAVETWPFIDAVYWAIVTITTVGYGDITPKTASGRAFCIVYILLGSLVVARAISVFIQY
ncbi:unnamed protein product, partial [Ectocarpus fasciculatus]